MMNYKVSKIRLSIIFPDMLQIKFAPGKIFVDEI